MTNNLRRGLAVLAAFTLPVLHMLVVRLIYDHNQLGDFFELMTIGFLFFLPFVAGVLTIYLSSDNLVAKIYYCVLAPIVPVVAFMVITLLFSLEGWACWVMAFPLFVIAGILGGFLGRFLKQRAKRSTLQLSLVVLLPFLISPAEQWIGANPSTYTADTYIDIEAPAEKIWANVTRVQDIPEAQDKGWLTRNLGFPRPVKAELDFAGVGGAREAIFTNGLVFHETVTEYIDQKKMVFTIKAYPHEIPSTTMDEHIVIGGEFFDVIDGTYELEQLNPTTHRLHLYSHFKLTTTFNFYASWWATWIMQDIQNNILQVEKRRAEGTAGE